MINLAIQLDFDNLSALRSKATFSKGRKWRLPRSRTYSIVDVRTDDETFLSSFYTMADCDNISWLKKVGIKVGVPGL